MIINIQDDILTLHNQGLLKRLLEDKTTKKNIMWATDAYSAFGERYFRNEEIRPELITGANSDIIKTRARKELEHQAERTKQRAEVFTPLWICKRMNDDAERYWLESIVGNKEDLEIQGYIDTVIKDKKLFKKYIDSKRLEITCGEAPYLVSRYDVATGEMIPVDKRIGLLDRKLQTIGNYAQTEDEWFKLAIRAYQSIFGYEFQGDNVLIARVNMLLSLSEHMQERWDRKPTQKELEKISNIVSWNIWQMDGLTLTIPYSEAEEHFKQLDWFGLLEDENNQETEQEENTQPYCLIYDWHNKKKSIEFQELKKGMHMKFDFIIGNPPYQEEQEGDNKKYAPPIYHIFMDEAYGIGKKVELIHPARFLFNAGSTPKDWNNKMLNDSHFKVLLFEQNSSSVFPNTDIKGGVAISYRDEEKEFGPIGTFTSFPELNVIMKKAAPSIKDSLMHIVFIQNRFNLEALYDDYPDAKSAIGSNGKDKRFEKNIFTKVSEVFYDEQKNGDDIKVLGIINNIRTWKYIPRKYVDFDHENLLSYKVMLPTSNGSGAIGEVISTPLIGEPLIGEPLIGHTRSFISIGSYETRDEAEACLKYIKSKFCRTMLGILKITQDNNKDTWRLVPIQDFTRTSDIDWSQSISDVDRQLYKKYGLSKEEIDFIETHVKEME